MSPNRRFSYTVLSGTAAALVFAVACARPVRTAETGGDIAPVATDPIMVSDPSPEISAATITAETRIANWPAKQRELATSLIAKYGQPAESSDRMLVWFNTGPYIKTVVKRDAAMHNFPEPHEDFIVQTIQHTVPGDKVDDLWQFDGSVWVHRTRGEVSAECGMEEANFLAFNLAHEVLNGKRSAADARKFYAKTIAAFMQGDRSSPYMQGLMFQTEPNAADPDKPLKP